MAINLMPIRGQLSSMNSMGLQCQFSTIATHQREVESQNVRFVWNLDR